MPRHRAISTDREFINNRPKMGNNLIKSAERVIQILELFSDLRHGATVADVADKLQFPQSSTSGLLRSLQALGYLTYGLDDRTYKPTSRVALLGHWIDPDLICDGPLIKMVGDLAEQTNSHAFLVTRNRLHVQILYFDYGHKPTNYVASGTGQFLMLTATGQALMTNMSERDIAQLVTATNAELKDKDLRLSPRDVVESVALVKVNGYAAGPSLRWPGQMIIAVPLPYSLNELMALAVSVPKDQPSADLAQWVETMKQMISKWLD